MLIAGVFVLVGSGLIFAIIYGFRVRKGLINPEIVLTRRQMILLGSVIALIGWGVVWYFQDGLAMLSWYCWLGLVPFGLLLSFEMAVGKEPKKKLLYEWLPSCFLCIPYVGQIGTAVVALVCLLVVLGDRQRVEEDMSAS